MYAMLKQNIEDKVPDITNLATKTTLNAKINEVKACVCYLLPNCYFLPNDSPFKTMKNVFYFIWKALFVPEIFRFLYSHLSLFFSLSAIALEVDQK